MARVPLYKQAETEMMRRITEGEWPVGQRLGNEFELAHEFGVSQGTMRRALISLEGMGYLHRKPGRGTLVARPEATANGTAMASGGFQRLTGQDGGALDLMVFRSRTSQRRADPVEAGLFGDGQLHTLSRTLKCDDARFALEEIASPSDLHEELPADFIDLLEELGQTPARIDDRLHAEAISMGDSVALSTDRHAALLCLTRVAYDGDGKAIARQVLRMAGSASYGVTLG